MIPILLNALNVTKATLAIPGTGVWIADLDIDLDVSGVVPTGKAALTIGGQVLIGTVDPRSTGEYGPKAHVQLVGGGGGWDSFVPAQDFQNDAGVLSTSVFGATAATVGEVVFELLPRRLKSHYVRSAGPASRVLAGTSWYVDFAGVTQIASRLPVPLDLTETQVLEWDPDTRTATLSGDSIVVPGSLIVDTRFGTATVRDVEHSFGPDGARCTAWCATADSTIVPVSQATEVAGHRLARALGGLAREATQSVYSRPYRYRIIIQGFDKRLTLQATSLTQPVPPVLQNVEVWPGVAGATSRYTPGTECSVVFLDGDPSQPIVVGFAYDAPTPLETQIDAIRIALGFPAISPVGKAPGILAAIAALQAQVTAQAAAWAALGALPGPILGALVAPIAAPVAAATATGTAAVASASAQVPSTKTFTD